MTLVDTSVWVDHFRNGNKRLTKLLNIGGVFTHPFIIGELSCGNLKNRKEILFLIKNLPTIQMAEDHEVLDFIEKNKLYGKGVGIVDFHLLVSCVIEGAQLFTLDKRLFSLSSRVLT